MVTWARARLDPRFPLPPARCRLFERTLAEHIRQKVVEHVGLGFENYGDHSSGGYVKGSFLWDNNEYDLPAGCITHFARTGDREVLRLGLAGALHYLDVDTIHYSSRKADWAGVPHVHSHATFGHHTAEAPNFSHAGCAEGLLWYSYLTGEPIGVRGAQNIADWVLRNLHFEAGMERAVGHPLMTLNDVDEATWDERYLRGSAWLVDQALKWEHPERSGFLAHITELPRLLLRLPLLRRPAAHRANQVQSMGQAPGNRGRPRSASPNGPSPMSGVPRGWPPEQGRLAVDLRRPQAHRQRPPLAGARLVPAPATRSSSSCPALAASGFGETVGTSGTRATGLVLPTTSRPSWRSSTPPGRPAPEPRFELITPTNPIPVLKGHPCSSSAPSATGANAVQHLHRPPSIGAWTSR